MQQGEKETLTFKLKIDPILPNYVELPPLNQQNEKNIQKLDGKIEQRQKIIELPKNRLEGVQGQLQYKFDNDEQMYGGSGTLCIYGDGFQENKYFLLTCASNVMMKLDEGQMKTISQLSYYYSRLNKEKFYCCLVGEKFTVHPGYDINGKIGEGFDLALVKLITNNQMEDKQAPLSQNSDWGCYLEQTDAQPGSIIQVIGYPQEYEGQLYSMKGNIKEIRNFDDGHAIILYDNIQTSQGQNGSPLYLQIAEDQWTIIGVHVGYDPISQCGVATAITKVVLEWIYELQSSM